MKFLPAIYYALLIGARLIFLTPKEAADGGMFRRVPDWYIYEIASGPRSALADCAKCELILRYRNEMAAPEPGSPEFAAWVAEDKLY